MKQKKKQEFTKYINAFIASFESERKDTYNEIYHTHMEDVISSEKDIFLQKIPELKAKYKEAVEDLVAISKNNTVLFTTEKEREEFEETVDIVDWTTKKSNDIINTLPHLADFIETHKALVIDILNGYLERIVDLEFSLWLGLAYKDSEKDFFRNAYDSSLRTLLIAYRVYIKEMGWNSLCNEFPKFKNEKNHKMYIDICEHNDMYHKWKELWYKNFQEISIKKGYGTLYGEITNFVHQVKEEFGNPPWLEYPTQKFSLMFYSSFPIIDVNDFDRAELMRIRDLYINGTLKGDYSKFMDPKYKK